MQAHMNASTARSAGMEILKAAAQSIAAMKQTLNGFTARSWNMLKLWNVLVFLWSYQIVCQPPIHNAGDDLGHRSNWCLKQKKKLSDQLVQKRCYCCRATPRSSRSTVQRLSPCEFRCLWWGSLSTQRRADARIPCGRQLLRSELLVCSCTPWFWKLFIIPLHLFINNQLRSSQSQKHETAAETFSQQQTWGNVTNCSVNSFRNNTCSDVRHGKIKECS